jgi:predicted flap endonuclease-1-like 5' DNA nuclease
LKKKTPEQGDPHERESHIGESFEKHREPSTTPLSITGIPMPLIAPGPVFTPKPAESSSSLKGEFKMIKGIDDETAAKLGMSGIKNIDDLAKASAEALSSDLKVPESTVQKWIDRAKRLQ